MVRALSEQPLEPIHLIPEQLIFKLGKSDDFILSLMVLLKGKYLLRKISTKES